MKRLSFSLFFLVTLVVSPRYTVARTPSPSFSQVLQQAQSGDPRAEYTAGMMILLGKGTHQNLPEAVRWLTASANANVPQAIFALAALYDVGQGVSQDTDRAMQLRQQAAKMGDQTAQEQLDDLRRYPGQADFCRASVLEDLHLENLAQPYAERAAAAGNANANLMMGRFYQFGLGNVRINLPLAATYYRVSAAQGLAEGMRHLAYMYEVGKGVAANRSMALRYYDKAAEKGDELARAAAANLRSPGSYVPPSTGNDVRPSNSQHSYTNTNHGIMSSIP